jgi:hypothetical protein
MARRINQLTLRDIDPRVLLEIQRLSRTEGLSLNKAAAKLLKQGAGLRDAASHGIGSAVDRFIGKLSRADAAQLSRALRSLDQVDAELWK